MPDDKGAIVLKDDRDIMLVNIAQNAIVTGATLPSGLKIPNTGTWIVVKHTIINKDLD